MNTLLSRSWWVVFPAFSVLVARLSYERACEDPYRLLGGATSSPLTAYPIALLYVAAHGWLLAAYLRTASVSGSPWPSATELRAAWPDGGWKILLMVVALAIEYWPVSLWRALGCGAP